MVTTRSRFHAEESSKNIRCFFENVQCFSKNVQCFFKNNGCFFLIYHILQISCGIKAILAVLMFDCKVSINIYQSIQLIMNLLDKGEPKSISDPPLHLLSNQLNPLFPLSQCFGRDIGCDDYSFVINQEIPQSSFQSVFFKYIRLAAFFFV